MSVVCFLGVSFVKDINSLPLSLTYDDVLLIPQRSLVRHRRDVDTTAYLTSGIRFKVPFISANMDTVTESEMAIAMATNGAIGFIHRFMSVAEQAENVKRVKRHEGFLIDDPYTIGPDRPLKDLVEQLSLNGISGFVVVDPQGKLLGLISRRDFILETDLTKKVESVMTPFGKLKTARPGVSLREARKIFQQYKIEKLPLVDGKGYLKGLVTARSILRFEKNPLATVDSLGRLRCGAAVGVVGDFLERAGALLEAGTDVLVVDVAHGQSIASLEAIKKLKKKFPKIPLIGGNVATGKAAKDLAKAGADAVKVGIGPGGLCTTRIMTGVGVPQLTAVAEVAGAVAGTKVKVIADGGTNYPGDITKALAAGADCVMLAGWFAGTDESPGEVIIRRSRRYKIHRGSASFLSQADRLSRVPGDRKINTGLNSIVPEGVEALIEYKGQVKDVIYQLLGALRSGMSYCGATTLAELQKNAKFVRITSAGFNESKAHNVYEI